MLSFDTLFPDRPTTSRTTWRWFWPVLALAFVARLAVAAWGDVLLHPDEIYQYHEQAYRLVYGYGLVPWEYTFGIRSWLIPMVLAGVLSLGQILGLDEPWLYMPLVKGVLCLLSLTLPVGMYRLTQAIASERAAILAFLFGAFWHHFLYYAHKPMPGILATYALIWMVVLMLRPAGAGRLFAFGLLSGLILTLRYQLIPVIGLLNLAALLRLGRGYGMALAGNVAALILAGLLDLVTWGGFLSSFIDNFRLNFAFDIASTFGEKPLDFYVRRLTIESGGIVVVAVAGIVLIWARLWPLVVALAVGVLAFHIPAHKEFRFVVWIMPFVMIGAAIAAAHPRLPTRLATAGLLVWAGAWSALFVGYYSGTPAFKTEARQGAAIFRTLSRADGVTGVAFRTPTLSWAILPGYYGLNHPAPFFIHYWPDADSLEILEERRAEASHIITEEGEPDPEGFDVLARHGRYTIWQARDPRPDRGFEGIDQRTVYPEPIPRDFRPLGGKAPAALGQLPRRADDRRASP